MTKTVFILRGFKLNTTASDPDYQEIRNVVEPKGYRIAPVKITWNRKSVSDFAKQFTKLYEQEKSEYNIVIGGSLGAMAALASTPLTAPNELVLCSLSALFQEDLARYDAIYTKHLLYWLGKRRLEDFETLSADKLADQINEMNIKTTLTYGEIEKQMYPQLVARVRNTAAKIHNSKLVEIPNAGHRMHEPEYIAGLRQLL